MKALRGELSNTSWEEKTYAEREGDRKLTHAVVTQELGGDIGSGTGDWSGMRGEGRFQAPHGSKASFTLDCSFD